MEWSPIWNYGLFVKSTIKSHLEFYMKLHALGRALYGILSS